MVRGCLHVLLPICVLGSGSTPSCPSGKSDGGTSLLQKKQTTEKVVVADEPVVGKPREKANAVIMGESLAKGPSGNATSQELRPPSAQAPEALAQKGAATKPSGNAEVAVPDESAVKTPSGGADPQAHRSPAAAAPGSLAERGAATHPSGSADVADNQDIVTHAIMERYPGYEGKLEINGKVDVTAKDPRAGGPVALSWNLAHTDDECKRAPDAASPPNACGIHIHEGTTCDDAQGHFFYTPWENKDDPWKKAFYTSQHGMSLGATSDIFIGEGISDIVGRTVVVHDHTGGRVACGKISLSTPAKSTAFSSSGSWLVVFLGFFVSLQLGFKCV